MPHVLRFATWCFLQLSGLKGSDGTVQNEELQALQALSGRGGASQQSGSHSTRVVDNLRMQLNTTTSTFKSVLEVRRDALQASEARRNLFASSVPSASESLATACASERVSIGKLRVPCICSMCDLRGPRHRAAARRACKPYTDSTAGGCGW